MARRLETPAAHAVPSCFAQAAESAAALLRRRGQTELLVDAVETDSPSVSRTGPDAFRSDWNWVWFWFRSGIGALT